MRWTKLPELENLPADWRAVRLLDVADVIAGQSPPSENYNERQIGLPFLQGNADFSDEFPLPRVWCVEPKKFCNAGATLISVRAPVGALNRADQVYALGRGLAALEARTIDADFLYYLMKRWRVALQRVGQGTTFDAITSKHLSQLVVPVPIDTEEQQFIASILRTVDEAIKCTRMTLEKSRIVKHGLLQKLLTCGVDANGEVRKFETSPDKFKSSRLGRIPEAWSASNVNTEFNISTGFTLGEHRRPRVNKRKYLRVANVQRDRILLDDVAELEASDKEMLGRRLEENDLLVVEGHANPNEIGRCARVKKDAVGLTFQNHLFRLKAKRLDPRFACLWLNSYWSRAYWRRMCATSSGLNTINQRLLKALLVIVPDVDEQQRIVALSNAQNTLIQNTQNSLQELETLKRGLMQDLLTGKVRVKQLATTGSETG